MILPSIISAPIYVYSTYLMFFEPGSSGVNWWYSIAIVLYLIAIYYLVFRTNKITDYIIKDKDKENESEINLGLPRHSIVFFAVVLTCLTALATRLPTFIIQFIQGMKENGSSLMNFLDSRPSKIYFITEAAELILFIVVLLNAGRVTAWVEWYRRKQIKSSANNTPIE